jgi:hypothetical protein
LSEGQKKTIPHNSGRTLDADTFALLFGTTRDDIIAKCGELIPSLDFNYEIVTAPEQDAITLDVLKAVDNGNFKVSGKERINDWEQGWQENLDAFVESGYDISSLAPKYISKYEISRLFQQYIRPHDGFFELNYYTVYRQYLFSTYLSQADSIFEFGCGTGYNMAIMSSLFPRKRIMGLDWAESSVKIADMLGSRLNAPISGRRFDYFHPDLSLDIPPGSAVITLNSLEQIGGDYSAFLDFIIAKKPAICINAEPFLEMYDENNLIDYLAIRYHKQRNYLCGYYSALKQLECDGKILIEKAQRVPVGNYFHEGYSFIVWHVI